MKKYGLLLLLPLLAISYYLLNEKQDKTLGIPEPTGGTIVKMDMEEGDNKTQREAWFELMHKTEEGVEWKMVEHDNMMSSYQDKLRRKQDVSTRGDIEPVADGILEGAWSERGASEVAGNVRITTYDSTTDILYAISDGGTLWQGDLSGFFWEVLNQEIQFSAGLLEVAHLQDGTFRIIASINNRPFYSDDIGVTWNPASNWNTQGGSKLFDSHVIQNENTGINEIFFLSRETWNQAISVQKSNVEDMDFKQERSFTTSDHRNLSMARVGNGNDVFILEQLSAGTSKIFQWDAEADNFVNINNNTQIGSGEIGRINLDVVMIEDTLRMYSYNDAQEFYKSSDLGQTWELQSILPINPWEVGVYIIPSDPKNLILGGVNAYRSNNGGQNWQIVNEWWEYYQNTTTKLHADIMSFEEYTDSAGEPFLLINNHGGISMSRNYGKENVNIGLYGLNTAQYYDVRTLPSSPEWVFAGSQDQGFQKGILQDDQQVGGFEQIISGDYGHIEFTNNGTNLWTVYPGGSASFYDEPKVQGPTAGWTIGSSNETVWIPPMMADPDPTLDIMYIAGGSADGGSGSYMIKMTFESDTIRAENMPYNFISDGTISAMMTSPLNADLWYVATTTGKFFTSTDRGLSFEKGNIFGPGSQYLYGSGILPSAEDENVVYFCGSGYNGPAAYKSEDKGATWTEMGEGLPPTLMFNMVANEDETLLYGATEAGPYVYIVAEEQWFDLSGASTPTQRYWSVEYLEDIHTARFGTYGRGIWDFKLDEQFVDTKDITVNTSDLTIFPNPASDIVTLKIDEIANESFTARIIDINGKIVSQKKIDISSDSATLDVSDLNTGNYVIQLINSKKQYAQKIIKI